MQLQKQAKKAAHKDLNPHQLHRIVRLDQFNPVIAPGVETVRFSTMDDRTTAVVVTQPRRVS